MVIGRVIAMAHSLGLQVIAEGVETIENRMLYLRTHLCDEMQGFLFQQTLAADAATDFPVESSPAVFRRQ